MSIIDIIQEGIIKKLIVISEDEKQITYIHQNRKRNFTNPEEKVQAETYLKLILTYGYNPERILLSVPVKMGSETKEADIVVYNDDKRLQPHIFVECKKQEVSEMEFLQAVEQAYSYSYALPNYVKYIWITSGLKDEYFEVDKKKNTRDTIPDIPQFGVNEIASFKFVYNAQEIKNEQNKQKFFDLKIIQEDELTRRFKQAHDALWAGGHLNPSEAFDELDKLIFCKIWDERKYRQTRDPYDFQIFTIDKNVESDPQKRKEIENKQLYDRIKNLYEEGRKKDPGVFKDDIRLPPEKIRTVVGYLESINLSETDLDSKGRAFETFMDSFFRGNFGQYFTPRPIVKFMVDVLPIDNESKVLDTSCGSGGFLLYALNKVREQANSLYPNYKTDTNQSKRHYLFWHEFAVKNLYGIEINEQISRVAKMNMIISDDGHTNVINTDGLLLPEYIVKNTKNEGFKYGDFDFIITNPPFGAVIKKSEKNYFDNYDFCKKEPDWLDSKGKTTTKYRENQITEILFIEQCHNYLREGGYLAIVLPDGILTNSSLQYVRDSIEDKYRIVAVISIPQTAFSATGAGVKSSLLFLKKHFITHTDNLRNLKLSIQNDIKNKYKYYKKIEEFEKEKTEKIKNLTEFNNTTKYTDIKDLKKTNEYKEWKDGVNNEHNEKVNNLKEQLQDDYLKEKQKQLPDYPIFMAIADDIGYDATGKKTNNNELDDIAVELKNFIETI